MRLQICGGFIAVTETGLLHNGSSGRTFPQGTESLSGHFLFFQQREIALCLQRRQTLLHVVHQHKTQPLVCTDHLLVASSGVARSSQKSCYLFTPGLSKQLAQACLTLYCHSDATVSCQGGEVYRSPLRGHLRLHLGRACKLDACTANESNLRPRLLCKVDITTTSSRVSYSSLIANVNICS